MIIERIINSVFSSNTFLLHLEDKLDYWLIDIGDVEPLIALLPMDAQVRGVLVTHSHYDHIYGLNILIKRFPACTVYASEHGREGLFSDKLNISRYHGKKFVYEGDSVRVLHEGDRVELWPDVIAEVFETPGHDWSCLTYRVGDAVFTGDSFLPGVEVFTKFPKSVKTLADESEKRIMNLARGCFVWPGHGDETKM